MIALKTSRLALRKLKIAAACFVAAAAVWSVPETRAASGDPQVKTDHPWYQGELSCSTFDRLFKTQAELYKRVTGRDVSTDEDKALASWYWRNIHYAHGEEGKIDCFGGGFAKGDANRDYWTGLFAHGFALCGTTHSQWNAEMHYLLGAGRSRVTGVTGHNSFEVYLKGGAYGEGMWALLDHDISTVVYNADGTRLLSIKEISEDLKTFKNPAYKPERQHGWRVAGLHDDDAGAYSKFGSAEYLSGYAGPPPMVHLRSGESLRRYLQPGLEDGKTFVFWGMNYNTGGIPGLTRDRTWVNQPDKMFNSKTGTGYKPGQVRFANAVFTYTPDFATDAYKQGVVDEAADHVTFEFQSPYVIGATPANTKAWGVYDEGAKNGLILKGSATCPVQVSVDSGKTWQDGGTMADGLDLTDKVKGFNQYLLRFNAPVSALKGTNLSWQTVCQTNVATIPHLKDGENAITYQASGQAIVSAGPTKAQAEAHVVDGAIGTNTVTLELKTPRGEKAVRVYGSAWQASGAPPKSEVKYQIEYSVDAGATWKPVVKDWTIIRHDPEPADFWSQSFSFGDVEIPNGTTAPVRVRFSNSGGKTYRTVQAHLAYEVAKPSPVEVTFAWTEAGGAVKTASHVYENVGAEDASWKLPTGQKVETKWVQYSSK
jgi:hypothetical protein